MRRCRFYFYALPMALALLVMLGVFVHPVWAQSPANPALIQADEITYDEELDLIIARGHVEITRGDRIVVADTVTFNRRTNMISADGNVSMVQPSGDVLFANHADLTDDFKDAVAEGFGAILVDQSRLAADRAVLQGGTKRILNRAVYSPCALCPDDPSRPPVWQIKAARAVHDTEAHTITYNDAWMEFLGVPIFYTPYYSQADPTVDRKTGFLNPSVGYSERLGYHGKTPFFLVLGRDKDLTLTPLFTELQGISVAGEYRQRFSNGKIRLGGSAGFGDRESINDGEVSERDRTFRGHIDSEGQFHINDYWRAGFDVNRSTDPTYLRLYRYSNQRTLTSRGYLEGFSRRSYASLSGAAYQGTRVSDDNDTSPIVVPNFLYDYVSDPNDFGSYYTLKLNSVVLSRIEGADSRRASLTGGWHLPYTSPYGDVYDLSLSVEGDVYWVDNFTRGGDDPSRENNGDSDLIGRIFPQATFTWRYPFTRDIDEGVHEILQPIFNVTAAPNNSNSSRIPNEDSQDVEFDEANLFRESRFAGIDRLDTGQRVSYGLDWKLIGDSGGTVGVFAGQSYQLDDNDNFPVNSGLEEQLSDVVGRLDFSPNRYVYASYRLRIDTEDFSRPQQELSFRLGPPAFNVGGYYAFVEDETASVSDFSDREQINLYAATKITDYWSANAFTTYDFALKERLITGGTLSYLDECFGVSVTAYDSRYSDVIENEPEFFVGINIFFKNLGDFKTSF